MKIDLRSLARVRQRRAETWHATAKLDPALNSEIGLPGRGGPCQPPSPNPQAGAATRHAELAPELFFVGFVPVIACQQCGTSRIKGFKFKTRFLRSEQRTDRSSWAPLNFVERSREHFATRTVSDSEERGGTSNYSPSFRTMFA